MTASDGRSTITCSVLHRQVPAICSLLVYLSLTVGPFPQESKVLMMMVIAMMMIVIDDDYGDD